MSTYTQILYQIVFSTRRRKKTLIKSGRPELFKCIWGILERRKCHLYRVNGVEDHIHIIMSLHPTQALADVVKDIKTGTHFMIKDKGIFPDFDGWQSGYGAFTYSIDAKENLINYVINQETHHNSNASLDEYKSLLEKHKIDYDQKYLE